MAKSISDPSRLSPETRLVRAGRDNTLTGQFVNPPVIHASTVLFDSVDSMLERRQRYAYGRRGTPTSDALEMANSELEGAAGTVLCPSGLSAISTALLSCLSSGDQVLMVDCVYGPVRHLAQTLLSRLGIETTFFDPALGATDVAKLFTDRTRAVYLESPGSLTFEMQDIPEIAAMARARNATVLVDNTWATPLYFKPLAAGADLSIQAGTKYMGGHSDVNLGTVAANAQAWPALKEAHGSMGICVGPDDIYLALRGLRTLAVRLDRQMRSGIAVAEWLESRPEVAAVLHPALPSHAGHTLWKRDMSGASGLFSFVLGGWTEAAAKRFIDGLELFGIGASWGGYESLVILARPQSSRSDTTFHADGPLIRLHIGLEDPSDLIADLEASLTRAAAG